MSDKYTIKLSEQEQVILSDVIAAANASTQKYTCRSGVPLKVD